MKRLDIPQDRGFYALRKTAASEIERIDPMATEMFLGHSQRGLIKHYAERNWLRLDEAIMELFKIMGYLLGVSDHEFGDLKLASQIIKKL